ncbi:response regulator transcription factor [Paenibacillus pinistramenti]|uniref:response regulator transcription factor n=1 Tax=Paenibacillus pinistramenti TaxID=1768003 RepID=UPI001107D5D4|nr:response regulator transcription factor [Paenibacillus pinistramenti]
MNTYCKVLVVDDEMLVRQGIKYLFDWESEGFTIAGEASNGEEALELIPQLEPHIILMDIVMPVMDGEELARRIQTRYPGIKIIVLSSFSEFEYVRSTFQSGASDYILKPKLDAKELLAILKKVASAIPALQGAAKPGSKERVLEAALDKLLSGYPLENEQLRGAMGDIFPYPLFMLLAAEPSERSAAAAAEDLQPVMTSVFERLAEAYSLNISFRALRQDEGRVRLLLNTDESSLEALPDLLQELTHDCGVEGHPAAAALSAAFHQLDRLHEAAEEIPALLEKRFFLPEERVFIGGRQQQGQQKGQQLAHNGPQAGFDSEAFNHELNEQDFHAAFTRLRRYLTSMPGRLDTEMYDFKSLMGHSVFNIILALLRFQYEARQLEERKYEYFRRIHEAVNIHEAVQLVEAFLEEAEECIQQRMRSAGGQAVQRILAYIQDNYAEPLTLTEIAQHFHFNPSYLSNYFATHNKEGFSEYLNKVRIEKACELLRQGDKSISDISSLVGYSDHSYFTKVFRKLKGVSPSQYRRQPMEGLHEL